MRLQVSLRWNNEMTSFHPSILFYWNFRLFKDAVQLIQYMLSSFPSLFFLLLHLLLFNRQLLVTILLSFMVTDLMGWGTPLCLHVSHKMCVLWPLFCSASAGEPLRFARPHWLNHQPVWLCWVLQLSTVRLSMEQKGLQPSLSTSEALKGAVSWFCSCS